MRKTLDLGFGRFPSTCALDADPRRPPCGHIMRDAFSRLPRGLARSLGRTWPLLRNDQPVHLRSCAPTISERLLGHPQLFTSMDCAPKLPLVELTGRAAGRINGFHSTWRSSGPTTSRFGTGAAATALFAEALVNDPLRHQGCRPGLLFRAPEAGHWNAHCSGRDPQSGGESPSGSLAAQWRLAPGGIRRALTT